MLFQSNKKSFIRSRMMIFTLLLLFITTDGCCIKSCIEEEATFKFNKMKKKIEAESLNIDSESTQASMVGSDSQYVYCIEQIELFKAAKEKMKGSLKSIKKVVLVFCIFIIACFTVLMIKRNDASVFIRILNVGVFSSIPFLVLCCVYKVDQETILKIEAHIGGLERELGMNE